MIFLWSILGVLWCRVFCLIFKPFWVYFLCLLWGCVLTSLIYIWLSCFPSTTCWRNCLFPIVCSCLLCRSWIKLFTECWIGLVTGNHDASSDLTALVIIHTTSINHCLDCLQLRNISDALTKEIILKVKWWKAICRRLNWQWNMQKKCLERVVSNI